METTKPVNTSSSTELVKSSPFEMFERQAPIVRDPRVGNYLLLRSPDNSRSIMAIEKIFYDPADLRLALSQAKELAELDHPSLLRLLDFSSHTSTSRSKQTFSLRQYYDLPGVLLEDNLGPESLSLGSKLSIGKKHEFVKNVFAAVVEACAYLNQKGLYHGDICPAKIHYYPATTSFKLCLIGCGSSDTYQRQLEALVNKNRLFVSPAVAAALQNRATSKIVHSPPKSDVFSLGLVILKVAFPASFKGIYDIKGNLKKKELKKLLDRFATEFPQSPLIPLLTEMTKINEAQRPDFLKLKSLAEDLQLTASPSPLREFAFMPFNLESIREFPGSAGRSAEKNTERNFDSSFPTSRIFIGSPISRSGIQSHNPFFSNLDANQTNLYSRNNSEIHSADLSPGQTKRFVISNQELSDLNTPERFNKDHGPSRPHNFATPRLPSDKRSPSIGQNMLKPDFFKNYIVSPTDDFFDRLALNGRSNSRKPKAPTATPIFGSPSLNPDLTLPLFGDVREGSDFFNLKNKNDRPPHQLRPSPISNFFPEVDRSSLHKTTIVTTSNPCNQTSTLYVATRGISTSQAARALENAPKEPAHALLSTDYTRSLNHHNLANQQLVNVVYTGQTKIVDNLLFNQIREDYKSIAPGSQDKLVSVYRFVQAGKHLITKLDLRTKERPVGVASQRLVSSRRFSVAQDETCPPPVNFLGSTKSGGWQTALGHSQNVSPVQRRVTARRLTTPDIYFRRF